MEIIELTVNMMSMWSINVRIVISIYYSVEIYDIKLSYFFPSRDRLIMHYRADVDGLRAIAILFVILFHAGLSVFPSGFIGVDIFFVISGYLITGIINHALENKNFSFAQFYNRRLWRLQPAFLCLLLTTFIMTLVFYLPEDLINYARSARKTSLFWANHHFADITSDYFAQNNNQLPLLHTWSLAIEWQCYLIFPLFIYLAYQVIGKRLMPAFIYLSTAIALVFALYGAHSEAIKYYDLSSRFFEFLIGASVVLSSKQGFRSKYLNEALGLIAFVLLFYIATRTEIARGFPNQYALILCLATAVLLTLGKNNKDLLVTKLLTFKPLVFIGLLSYSIYIWHWPVFVIINYLGIGNNASVLFAAFTLIFLISYLSWRYIERTGKKFSKMPLQQTVVYLFVLPLVITHVASFGIKRYEGLPIRFKDTAEMYNQMAQYTDPHRKDCIHTKTADVINPVCVIGTKNKGVKKAIMFGDSFSNHYRVLIDQLAQKEQVSVNSDSISACLTLPNLNQLSWNRQRVFAECHEQTKRYYEHIKANHYDYVIIGQNWSAYLPKIVLEGNETARDRVERGVDDALKIITESGATPVFIKSISISSKGFNCYYNHLRKRQKYTPGDCNFKTDTVEDEWQNGLFARLQNKYSQLIVIDPKDLQCDKGICKADINGIPFFKDEGGHITDYASYQLADYYLKHNKNPFVDKLDIGQRQEKRLLSLSK